AGPCCPTNDGRALYRPVVGNHGLTGCAVPGPQTEPEDDRAVGAHRRQRHDDRPSIGGERMRVGALSVEVTREGHGDGRRRGWRGRRRVVTVATGCRRADEQGKNDEYQSVHEGKAPWE